MRRARLLLAALTAGLLLLFFGSFDASAQEEPLTSAEAMDLAASSERLEPVLREADAASAQLIHQISDSLGILSPMYWLVLMENEDAVPVGLVAVDSYTGGFVRETMVSPRYSLPQLDVDLVQQHLAAGGLAPEEYRLQETKLVFLGGARIAEGNYWIIPPVSGELADYLAFPAFPGAYSRLSKSLDRVGVSPLMTTEAGRSYYRLGDGLLREDRTGFAEDGEGFVTYPAADSADAGAQQLRGGSQRARQQQVEALARREDAPALALASSKKLSDVPLYYQGDTQGCGLFALAMVHQWWAPIELPAPHDAVMEMTRYQGSPGNYGPQYPHNVKNIMRDWDQVADGGRTYQDYQTTYADSFTPLSDVKKWIDQRDTPVLVLVNSDNASVGFFDHWIVITGYDDSTSKLFINNSGASVGSATGNRGSVGYGAFVGSYWVGAPAHWSGYMVAGYPGDEKITTVSGVHSSPTSPITDAEHQTLDLGLKIDGDDAHAGEDAYGDGGSRYNARARVRLDQGEGLFSINERGPFDDDSVDPQTEVVLRRTSDVAQGTTLGQNNPAVVFIDPARISPPVDGLGNNVVELQFVAYDEDDRTHGSEQIDVWEFVNNSGCNEDQPWQTRSDCYAREKMPKPVLRQATATTTKSYQVEDDVTDVPEITDTVPEDSSALGSSHVGAISLRPTFSTFLGTQNFCCVYRVISEATIHYEVYDENGNLIAGPDSTTVYPGPSQGIGALVPESEWSQGYPGGRVEWWVEATNTDTDRPGDQESMESSRFLVRLEERDDGDGQVVPEGNGTSRGSGLLSEKDIDIIVWASEQGGLIGAGDPSDIFGDDGGSGEPCPGGPLIIPDCPDAPASVGEASRFHKVAAGKDLVIGLAQSDDPHAIAAGETTEGLLGTATTRVEPGEAASLILAGLTDPENFAANPNGRSTELQVIKKSGLSEAADDTDIVHVYAVHTSTDAGAASVTLRSKSDDREHAFGEMRFGDASEAKQLSPDEYEAVVEVEEGSVGKTSAVQQRTFDVDLSDRGGQPVGLLVAGFLNPAANKNGPALTLRTVGPDGTVADGSIGGPIPVDLPTDIKARTGTEETIPVTVGDLTGRDVTSFRLHIEYDPALVEVTGISREGTLSEAMELVEVNATNPGELIIGAADGVALSGSGTLLNLEVSYQAAGDFTLHVSEALLNEGDPATETQDGGGTIIDVLFGDVTGDEQITALDAAHTLQHAVGLRQLEGVAVTAADVSGNGEIMPHDASLILQFFVEMIDCFPVESGCPAAGKQAVAASGRLAWGTPQQAQGAGVIEVPLVLSEGQGVRSLFVKAAFDASAYAVEEVTSPLGEEAMLAHRVAGDTLRLVLASAESFGGEVATVQLRRLQGEAAPTLAGSWRANEEAGQTLAAAEVNEIPADFALGQNYPNPFNPETTIRYTLPERAEVRLEVFDALGREVIVLVDDEKTAGRHEVRFDAHELPSGVYFYRIEAGGFIETREMTLVK